MARRLSSAWPQYRKTSGTRERWKLKLTSDSEVFHVLQSSKMKTRLIKRLVHQVRNHPNKNALIADLLNNHTYNPFSEESKKMIHNMGNVEGFELREISSRIQCSYCLKHWTEGIVYCICGTCFIHREFKRRLTKERFDALTILDFVIEKGTRHSARHGKT